MNSWFEETNPPFEDVSFYLSWLNRAQKGTSASFSPPSPPSSGRPLTLYSSLWTILVLHLLVIHAYTWVHVPSTTSSTCYELQQPRWYCSRVISSLMQPNHQLWAFNVEVTTSPRIAPPPYFHGWPTVLVLFAWDTWGGCLYGHVALLSHDFGWLRTRLSSVMPPSNWGSLG